MVRISHHPGRRSQVVHHLLALLCLIRLQGPDVTMTRKPWLQRSPLAHGLQWGFSTWTKGFHGTGLRSDLSLSACSVVVGWSILLLNFLIQSPFAISYSKRYFFLLSSIESNQSKEIFDINESTSIDFRHSPWFFCLSFHYINELINSSGEG